MTGWSSSTPNANTSGSSAPKAPGKASSGVSAASRSTAPGDVYVSDYGNDRVQEFSPTGAFIRKFGSAGTSAGQFLHPIGLAVDSSGNVWVLNSFGVIVQEFSQKAPTSRASARLARARGSSGAAGIAFSGGNLYISEWSNQRVQEFSTAGAFIRAFDEAGSGTGKSSLPWGIAARPLNGNLYVAEVGNDRVQEFSSAGTFIAAFGSAGSGAGQLSIPKGVAVSSAGNVFVADTGNERIQEWHSGRTPHLRSVLHRAEQHRTEASRNPKPSRWTRAGTSGSRTRAMTG